MKLVLNYINGCFIKELIIFVESMKLKARYNNLIRNQWGFEGMKEFFIKSTEELINAGCYSFYVTFKSVRGIQSIKHERVERSIYLHYPLVVHNKDIELETVRSVFIEWLKEEEILVDDQGGGDSIIIDLYNN